MILVFALFTYLLTGLGIVKLVGSLAWPKLEDKAEWRSAGLAGLLSIVFLLLFLSEQNTIAKWDRLGGWSCAVYWVRDVAHKPWAEAWRLLYQSIETQEYTSLACFWAVPFLQFMGDDYAQWVLVCYGMYALPFLLILWLGLRTWLLEKGLGSALWALPWVVVLCPALFIALLNNPSDVSGLPIAGGLLMAALMGRLEGRPWYMALVLAVLLVVMVALKRYYLFWGVACLVGSGLSGLAKLRSSDAATPTLSWKPLLSSWVFLGISVSLVLVVWYGFMPSFLTRTFFNNYAQTFTGHRYGDRWMDLTLFTYYFAPLFVGVVLFSWVRLPQKFPAIGVLLFTSFLLAFFGLLYVQSFDWNHYLILIGVLWASAVLGIWTNLSGRRLSLAATGLVVWGFLNMGAAFWPAFPYVSFLNPVLFTHTHLYPEVRSDLSSLEQLVSYLKYETQGTSQRVYVLASSPDYNEDVLRALQMPYSLDPFPSLYQPWEHASVDKKHGFARALVQAEYVVVGDPVQLHIRPEEQTLITWPAQQILQGHGIGTSYRAIQTFPVGQDVKLHVYQKVKGISYATYQAHLAYYKERYPDFPGMYQWGPLDFMLARRRFSGTYGQIEAGTGGTVLNLHPSDTGLATALLSVAGLQELGFTPQFINTADCGNVCKEAQITLRQGDAVLLDTLLTFQTEPQPLRLRLTSEQDLEIILGPGKNGTCCDALEWKDWVFVPRP